MNIPGIKPEDMSHAALVAILMHHGGTLTLPVEAFEADALGGADGSWHAVGWMPTDDKTAVVLSVQPRPDTPEGGITFF